MFMFTHYMYVTVPRTGLSSSSTQSHASLIQHLFDNIVCEVGLDFSVAQLAGGQARSLCV